MSEVKNINQLMIYLRNKHQIQISGSLQKRRLRNIGYYHGFKGYRYISTPGNQVRQIHYSDFNSKKDVIQHFYVNDQNVPIWAIFEVITIGEFGNFVSVANLNVKNAISKSLGLNQAFDYNGKLTESIIYQIKDLRNSIAHNDVIFDARFRSSNPSRSLIQSLERDTGIRNITSNTIVDYFILVIYLLKSFKLTKTELTKTLNKFESAVDDAKTNIPQTIYNQIFLPDTKNKLSTLRQYI